MQNKEIYNPATVKKVANALEKGGHNVRIAEGDMIGYSAVQLIETSLISAHFVDATSDGYIDIFSCKYYRPEDALTFCKDFFEAKDVKYNYLLRI